MADTDNKIEAVRESSEHRIDALRTLVQDNAVNTAILATQSKEQRSDIERLEVCVRDVAQSMEDFKTTCTSMIAEIGVQVTETNKVALKNKAILDGWMDRMSAFKINIFKLMWYGLVAGVLVTLEDAKSVGSWVIEWIKHMADKVSP
jgi:uncharacterized coiled-coil protein SlyX